MRCSFKKTASTASESTQARGPLPGRGMSTSGQPLPPNPAVKMRRPSSRAPLNKSGKTTNRSPTPRHRNSKQASASHTNAVPPRKRSPNKAVYLSLAQARQHEAAEKTRLLPMPPSLPSSIEELTREKEQERAATREYVNSRKAIGATTIELRDEGYTASELKDAGYTLKDCWGAGFAAPELCEAGFSPRAVKDLSKLARRQLFIKQAQNQQQDQQPQQLQPRQQVSSSSIAEAASKAYPVRKQATHGGEASAAFEGTHGAQTTSPPEASATMGASSTLAGGADHGSRVSCSSGDAAQPHAAVNNEGPSGLARAVPSSITWELSQRKAAGVSASELRTAGFSAADLRAAGYGLQECWNAGFAKRLLVEAGFSDKEVKQIAKLARRAAYNAAVGGNHIATPALASGHGLLEGRSSPVVFAM